MQAEKHGTKLTEVVHQNGLLKKAVAIQHQRGIKAAAEQEAQVQQLRSALEASQSQNASLQAANYALSVHLKQAMPQHHHGTGPPDVY